MWKTRGRQMVALSILSLPPHRDNAKVINIGD